MIVKRKKRWKELHLNSEPARGARSNQKFNALEQVNFSNQLKKYQKSAQKFVSLSRFSYLCEPI